MRRHILLLCATLGLGLVLACGGGGGSTNDGNSGSTTPATGLAYQDPSGSGWRLVKNPASSANHLVLDLVPPTGTSGRGVGLTFQADAAKLQWAKVNGGDATLLHAGNVYQLGSGTPATLAMESAGSLRLGLFQKGKGAAANYGSTGVLSVALELKSGTGLQKGAALTAPSAAKALHLPSSGAAETITVQVGTLTAQ